LVLSQVSIVKHSDYFTPAISLFVNCATQEEVEKIVLANDVIKKWVEDKPVKKLIFVKNKMVNIVI